MDDDERHDYVTGRSDKRDVDNLRCEELARGAGWRFSLKHGDWCKRKPDSCRATIVKTAREACTYDDLI